MVNIVQHRFYKDSYGFLLERSRYNGDSGRGDAIAKTVLAAITYREKDFIDAIEFNFAYFLADYQWIPQRHPEDPRIEDFSRDHTVWFVIWLRYFLPEELYQALRIPKQISEKFKQSFDMPFWIRSIARGWWIDKALYWIVCSIMLRFNDWWNRRLRKKAGIISVPYTEFKCTKEEELSKKELYARKHSVPSYIMDTQAFMIKCLDDGWFKDRLKKRMIPLVEPDNWLVRMLMDDVFTAQEKAEIRAYTGMDALRWSRRMDKTTDIDMFQLIGPQPPWNMDVDLLHSNLDWQ